MNNIIHFIKYNNFFTLAVALTLVGTGSAFAASPELRQTADDALIGKTETVVSVDNSALLGLDANAFDPEITITATTEDSDSYYLSYSFHTFEVINGAWQRSEKTGNLVIPKNALGSISLREYAEKQLREVAQKEIAFLKEVKDSEEKKGTQKAVVAVAYTGLLGLIIDPVEKEPESVVVNVPIISPEMAPVVPQETVPAVPVSESDASVSLVEEMVSPTLIEPEATPEVVSPLEVPEEALEKATEQQVKPDVVTETFGE